MSILKPKKQARRKVKPLSKGTRPLYIEPAEEPPAELPILNPEERESLKVLLTYMDERSESKNVKPKTPGKLRRSHSQEDRDAENSRVLKLLEGCK